MDFTHFSTNTQGTPCPECKAISYIIDINMLLNYFLNKELRCVKCNSPLDCWKMIMRHFEWGIPSYIYSLVGGMQTSLMIYMKPNQKYTLDMLSLGIPQDSKVLTINYTPNGPGLFPVEIHGNSPQRHFIPKRIHLFGMPHGESAETTPVAVSIDWFYKRDDCELWGSLVEALEAFSTNRFYSSIIPANVAVESKLLAIMERYLQNHAPIKKVSEFLTSGATYSHQLNILLPLVSSIEKFPHLPEHIRGGLTELRNSRNRIAHKGETTKPLDRQSTSRMLCSAFFAVGYLSLLEKKINQKPVNIT